MPGKSRAQQQAEAQASEEGHGQEGRYQHAFAGRARDACMLGATNEELANIFGVNIATIDTWSRGKTYFRRAVRAGREGADEKVARALYRRATGAKVKASKVFNHKGRAYVVDYTEEYPPDTNAAALWLSNRQRSKWRAAASGQDQQGGFDLAAFAVGLAALGAAVQARPGDAAKAIEPLDVEMRPPKSEPSD